LALAKDFGAKNALSYEKRVRKMMMKLTPERFLTKFWEVLKNSQFLRSF